MSVAQAIVGTVYMAIDYWALASVLGGVPATYFGEGVAFLH
jgi:hypothetical protein